VDTVTVVTEGIFSYCGLKAKIDTDRHLGPETARVMHEGEQIGHVTTAEYGSQMLSLGGVRHLTGGSKREGNVTCAAMLALCRKDAIEVAGGGRLARRAAGRRRAHRQRRSEARMRVGCGSAAIGIFAQQWQGQVDEVVVVDDHITGVLTEHQAGRCLGMRPSGLRVRGPALHAGRYFQVAHPGTGWGGTDVSDPLTLIESLDPKLAWPGMRILMTSTTGEDALWLELDEALAARAGPDARGRGAHRRPHRRELRAGAVFHPVHGRRRRLAARRRHENPILLTRGVQGRARCAHHGRRALHALARRRHHPDGRRACASRQRLRLRADARRSCARSSSRCAPDLLRRSCGATWSTASQPGRAARAARRGAARGRGPSSCRKTRGPDARDDLGRACPRPAARRAACT
jgi:hypothetical protein